MSDWIQIDWVLVGIVVILLGSLTFVIGFLNLVFDVREDNRIDRKLRKEQKQNDKR